MRFEERNIPPGAGAPAVSLLMLPAGATALPILEFEAAVLRLVDGGVRYIAIDLAPIERVDSRMIQALLQATEYCRRNHARLVLIRPTPFLRRTIRNLGLEPALPAFATDEEAIAYLKRVGRGSGLAVDFHPADEPDLAATALALGPTVDGIVLRYPWGNRNAPVDPRRLAVGKHLRLRPSWDAGCEITAEIERVEPVADEPPGAHDYHLAFRRRPDRAG
jgi:anti-anti-sigma regulatory factor